MDFLSWWVREENPNLSIIKSSIMSLTSYWMCVAIAVFGFFSILLIMVSIDFSMIAPSFCFLYIFVKENKKDSIFTNGFIINLFQSEQLLVTSVLYSFII